jgi:hypothetical protein
MLSKQLGQRFQLWKQDILAHKQKLAISCIFFLVAIVFKFISGAYTERKGFASPRDLILDNIPVINLSMIYVWLFVLVLFIFFFYPLIYNPRKLHYSIGLFSLLLMVRSGFTVLTHFKIPAEAVAINYSPGIFDIFSFTNDLFFSGQVGLAFMAFWIYRHNKYIRYFMLFSSITLGIVSLLMHIHYSIDVLSAFFISYAVYKIGDAIFRDEN